MKIVHFIRFVLGMYHVRGVRFKESVWSEAFPLCDDHGLRGLRNFFSKKNVRFSNYDNRYLKRNSFFVSLVGANYVILESDGGVHFCPSLLRVISGSFFFVMTTVSVIVMLGLIADEGIPFWAAVLAPASILFFLSLLIYSHRFLLVHFYMDCFEDSKNVEIDNN